MQIAIGKINTIDITKQTATVKLTDYENKITQPLAILCRGSVSDKDFDIYRYETMVLCLFYGDKDRGWILGTWFNDSAPAPTGGSINKKILQYPGGYIELDKDAGELNLNLDKKITITVPEIVLNVEKFTLNGAMTATGTITSFSDILSNTISLANHIHKYLDDGNPLFTDPPLFSLVFNINRMFRGWY